MKDHRAARSRNRLAAARNSRSTVGVEMGGFAGGNQPRSEPGAGKNFTASSAAALSGGNLQSRPPQDAGIDSVVAMAQPVAQTPNRPPGLLRCKPLRLFAETRRRLANHQQRVFTAKTVCSFSLKPFSSRPFVKRSIRPMFSRMSVKA